MDLSNIYFCLGGFLFGIFVCLIYIFKLQKEIKSAKKNYEKKSIGMDDSNMKIKTLENKIKTLEIALNKKLNG